MRAHRERRGCRVGLVRGQLRPRRSSGRPERLIDQPEVQISLGLACSRRQHPQPALPGQAPPRQGRLADPRITLDGHQPRLPGRDPRHDLRYLGKLRRPAHEHIKRRPPVLHAPTSLRLWRRQPGTSRA